MPSPPHKNRKLQPTGSITGIVHHHTHTYTHYKHSAIKELTLCTCSSLALSAGGPRRCVVGMRDCFWAFMERPDSQSLERHNCMLFNSARFGVSACGPQCAVCIKSQIKLHASLILFFCSSFFFQQRHLVLGML